MNRKLAVGIIALACASNAFSAQFTKDGKERISALVKKLDSTSELISTFDGPGGFAGAIVKSENDKKVIIWGTPNGDYLFAGNLFEAETARNLTDVASKHFKAENPVTLAIEQTAKKIIEELTPSIVKLETLKEMKGKIKFKISVPPKEAVDLSKKAADVGGGFLMKKGNLGTVYVYVDMDCPHCHAIHPELMALDANIVYLPVQAVGDDNEMEPIFRSGDPNVVKAYMDRVMVPDWKPVVPKDVANKRIEANRGALQKIMGGWVATPIIVALRKDGESKTWMGESVYQVSKFLADSKKLKKTPWLLDKKQPNSSK